MVDWETHQLLKLPRQALGSNGGPHLRVVYRSGLQRDQGTQILFYGVSAISTNTAFIYKADYLIQVVCFRFIPFLIS
ncbi:MAG: hypothetical protein QM660_14875 [Dysgonomonas sp.]